MRPILLRALLLLALGLNAAAASAQGEDAAVAGEPAAVPTPDPRPEPPAGPDEPGEVPEPDEANAATAEEAEAPDGNADAREPAYVSPDKARTTPEETAPDTPASAITPVMSVEAAKAIEDARLCEAELEARGAEFTVAPSVAEGECGVLRPVSLTETSTGIAVAPETRMLCRTALSFDIWVGESLVPAARDILDREAPTAIRQSSTYVCRDRASETGISEHARGSAIDIAGFEWADGATPILVEAQEAGSPEDRFLASVRRAACGPFRTVIGPGTNSDHADHFHLDIAARSNGSTYCR